MSKVVSVRVAAFVALGLSLAGCAGSSTTRTDMMTRGEKMKDTKMMKEEKMKEEKMKDDKMKE